MDNDAASLLKRIELLRSKLNDIFQTYNSKDYFLDEEIIKLSSELDKLIVEYYRYMQLSDNT
jgi:hypothetical protein